MMIKISARAKINLFLEVTGKRTDGFHNLESIFARISLSDVLFIKKGSGGIKLSVKDNSNLGKLKTGNNLVYSACDEFFRYFGISPAADIHLEKNIPVGAGLGGGSSDCAAALEGLARIYGVDSSDKRLFKIAEKLGSDVPFFLSGLPFAHCSGRGERIKAISVRANLPGILLVWPEVFISTKEVYGRLELGDAEEIRANLGKMTSFVKALESEGEPDFRFGLFNRLETAVFSYAPQVSSVRKMLSLSGLPSLMSGSGSSVFALSYSARKLNDLFFKLSPLHRTIFLAEFS